jgi:hypothetical protein
MVNARSEFLLINHRQERVDSAAGISIPEASLQRHFILIEEELYSVVTNTEP